MLRRMLFLGGGLAIAGLTASLVGWSTAAVPHALLLNPSHQCSYCHAAHDGQGGDLLISADVEVLCLTCHGPGGNSVLKAQNHQGQTCTVCHEPHDGEFNRFGNRNIKMMRSEVIPEGSSTPRPLTFESRGTGAGDPTLYSFCDGDEDNDGIWDNACDTCHTATPSRHQYGDTGSHRHKQGSTCTNCHGHDTGFLRR